MKNLILLLSFLAIILFAGIIDTGEEFVNLELGIKYPTFKMFFTNENTQIIALNYKAGILSQIIPFLLLQTFLFTFFIKNKKMENRKKYVAGIFLYFILFAILFVAVNIALFYGSTWVYATTMIGIILINYILITIYNNMGEKIIS